MEVPETPKQRFIARSLGVKGCQIFDSHNRSKIRTLMVLDRLEKEAPGMVYPASSIYFNSGVDYQYLRN
jgi:hypothetical protein